jgi:hypothetical protein
MKNKKLLIGGIVVLVAGIGGFLFYRYKKSKKTASDSETDSQSKLDSASKSELDSAGAELFSNKPTSTEAPKKPTLGFGSSITDKLKTSLTSQILKYKTKKPINANKIMGLGFVSIPENEIIEGKFLQFSDSGLGLFEGTYKGARFRKQLSISDLQVQSGQVDTTSTSSTPSLAQVSETDSNFKVKNTFSANKLMGIGMIVIPQNSNITGRFIQYIDDKSGTFVGRFNGIPFRKQLQISNLEKI